MLDSAKGSLSGYLFQFEIGLVLLAKLETPTDHISIEAVDDIASHKQDGTVLISVQAKHSISSSGAAFQDTSYALWRTIQIWIQKTELGVFNDKTQFICSANKEISTSSLLYKMTTESFADTIDTIQALLKSQRSKLKEKRKKDKKSGGGIKEVIELIKYIISKKDVFVSIIPRVQIEQKASTKEQFLNSVHLGGTSISKPQRDSLYDEFLGWIISASKDKWLNGKEARITKAIFDERFQWAMASPSIRNAIFRKKTELGTIEASTFENMRESLFVRQIDDIRRNSESTGRIIKNAIIDYIYSEIETIHIVDKGVFTGSDFIDFIDACKATWQECYDRKVLKEVAEYSDDEMNTVAIEIFDAIFHQSEVLFKNEITFNTNNKYIKNGSFLKLSDHPHIGWRPDWKVKYEKIL